MNYSVRISIPTLLTLEGNKYQNFHKSNKLYLALWLNQANASNLSISGNILLRKAADFARLLNIDGFGGTPSRFKKRYNIRYITKSGEANSAPLQDLLSAWDPNDVYNCDETALYWKMEPSKTLSAHSLNGTKQQRIE